MPYCDKCGSYVSEIETNCRACGAIIYPNASGGKAAPAAKVRRKPGTRIVIAVAVIIFAVAAALWLLSARDHSVVSELTLPDPQAFSSSPAASSAPAPTSEATPLRLGSWWHGYLTISNYEGSDESLAGMYEVWGYFGTASGRTPYFELYDRDTVDDDTIVLLSMFIDLYPDHFVPVIGEEDAWILDLYLDERDVDALTVYCKNGSLQFEYPYRTAEESFDIKVVVYPQ